MTNVITANTLKSGEVVFLAHDGWATALDAARLFDADMDLDAVITAHNVPDHVIGLYAIAVTVKNGVVTPRHIRERIRAAGPGNYNHTRLGDTAPMRGAS